MSGILRIVLSLVNLVTAILHILGCYLLTCQYRYGVQTSNQLFLINLSISEGTLNILEILSIPINGIESISEQVVRTIDDCQYYVKIVRGYGCVVMYYLTMVYLTLDKLFDILLNIRYPLYWREEYTKRLLKATWGITLTIAITASIVHYFYQVEFHEILDTYAYPILDVIFILIALVTYGFIFHKYKQTRRPPVGGMTAIPSPGRFQIFMKSRFFIPVLLITTFITFMAIPDMISPYCIHHIWEDRSNAENTMIRISFAVSYLSDAIIYIWVKYSVRTLLLSKLGFIRPLRSTTLRAPAHLRVTEF